MKYKTWCRVTLRLLGAFIVAAHLPTLVVRVLVTAKTAAFGSAYSRMAGSSWIEQDISMLVEEVLEVCVGLYLFSRGNWIIDRIIPSNRPYCHECGYEQTGLPAEGICPECGTTYRRAEREPPAR